MLTALRAEQDDAGFQSLQYDDQIGKLAVVGAGMRTSAGVSAQLFRALCDAGINIEMISTSEIRISVVTRADSLQHAMRVVHTAFGLDGERRRRRPRRNRALGGRAGQRSGEQHLQQHPLPLNTMCDTIAAPEPSGDEVMTAWKMPTMKMPIASTANRAGSPGAWSGAARRTRPSSPGWR